MAEVARLSDPEAVVVTRAYDQGARMLAAVGGALPARLDRACSTGHLMRLCLAHRRLSRQPHSLASAPGNALSNLVILSKNFHAYMWTHKQHY